MKSWALEYLQCPACRGTFKLHTFQHNDAGQTSSGILMCQNKTCSSWYPVIRSIPRLLAVSLRELQTQEFSESHYEDLKRLKLVQEDKDVIHDRLLNLKKHTIQNFGFEWVQYNRFGWDDPQFNTAYEESIFQRKSLITKDEVQNKIVLDAGCGNGRYCNWAARYGGKVIGVDLGDGVESAAQNTSQDPNVQIIQADIFHLPLKDNSIDVIYSIGVLMHTGDAHRATVELSHKVKPGGSLTVHLYGKGNFIYEFLDKAIRKKTTRMSIPQLQRFTDRLFRWRKILEKLWLIEPVNLFVRIDNHPVCIFDWYAAPIATHHTYQEVTEWFQQIQFRVLKTNKGNIFFGPKSRTHNKFLFQILKLIKTIIEPLENTPVTVRALKPLN